MNIFAAVAFVCVVLLLSIVIWSIRRHRDPTLHIECSSPIDELIPSLAGLTLSTAVAGNSVEVLENGAFFDGAVAANSIGSKVSTFRNLSLEGRGAQSACGGRAVGDGSRRQAGACPA